MINIRKDYSYLFLLLGLGIVFWWEALAPGKLFFYGDIPTAIVAKKLFWSGSGFPTLWSPYFFFGVPYAANPQFEAFYPLNFFFLLFGPERGVVYDVVLHHLFFLLTFYLALRRVGFGEEASLIGAAGFGFGGYLISLPSIPLFVRTIAWLGLLVICLNEALETKWLRWSLLLGLAMAAQIMGGEIQLAVMSWVLAFGVVVLAPKRKVSPRDLFMASGAMVLGLVGAVIVNLPQIALAKELIPLSNRAGGESIVNATLWSFDPSHLASLFVPNYLFPWSKGYPFDLGVFYYSPFSVSHYLGVTLLLLVIFSLSGTGKWRGLIWLVLALFGLGMILGDHLGVYAFLHKYLPGFDLFRFPDKFFLFLNFGFVLLAVSGYEYASGRKRLFPWGAGICLFAAVVIIVFLLIHPLRIWEFGNNFGNAKEYLFRRNILRISAFFLIGSGLILMIGKLRAGWVGLVLALALFGDLFFAHHLINQVTTEYSFRPDYFVRELSAREKGRIVPPRIFPTTIPAQDQILQVQGKDLKYVADLLKKIFEGGWSVYYGLNDIRQNGTFYPIDMDRFMRVLGRAESSQKDLILARSGVEYSYSVDRGFTGIPAAFARAMVFYQARMFSSQYQIATLWSTPDFPAGQTLLIEAEPGRIDPGSSSLQSEPARIIEYQNEKVTVEAEAKETGWLLLLDSYYPGWKAEVDGHPVEIFRADGFFRAVRIPAGKHKIVFNFIPTNFKKSVWVSGLGFLIWLGLIVTTFTRGKGKEKTI
ncbi:MAG: YfhO family protein [bacterium]|nr:YfhO family protein [bacterium]